MGAAAHQPMLAVNQPSWQELGSGNVTDPSGAGRVWVWYAKHGERERRGNKSHKTKESPLTNFAGELNQEAKS